MNDGLADARNAAWRQYNANGETSQDFFDALDTYVRAWLALPPSEEEIARQTRRACEAIYAEFKGYWPNESETLRIAVAVRAVLVRPPEETT